MSNIEQQGNNFLDDETLKQLSIQLNTWKEWLLNEPIDSAFYETAIDYVSGIEEVLKFNARSKEDA